MGQEDTVQLQGPPRLRRGAPDRGVATAGLILDPRAAAESLFREQSGRIIATLIRISGSFDRAEEAMQEAFAAALVSWPEKGIPQNPAAWIIAAAHRKLIDQVRREKTRVDKQDALTYETRAAAGRANDESDEASMRFPDDRLRLIF